MKAITKLFTAAQTSAALIRAFGPEIQWIDKLSDMRLHRGSVRGLVLLPAAATPASREKCKRPLYSAEGICEFIKSVRELFGTARPFDEPVGTFGVETLDGTLPASDRFWRLRIARPITGTPATA